MFHKRVIYLIIILLSVFLKGYAQMGDLGGIENIYTPITYIHTAQVNNIDSVEVADLTGFNEGDTVMIYVATGAVIDTSPGEDGNGAPVANNHGKYAILIIDEIVPPSKLVILNSSLPEIKTLKPGEVAQLIRVPSYRRAKVNSTLTGKKWDGSTGGVVALFIQRTLTLNADIDVSDLGFRGATETELYSGACASTDPDLYDSTFYYTTNPVKAGKKGEGITLTTFDYLRGKGRNINGGGGGNARLSGGGGGSNFNAGGKGGFESADCDSAVDTRGLGGMALSTDYYKNLDPIVGNRIFLGGGGGRGTNVSGQISSDGGDGGGIVVIIADSIEGNGNVIRADGESVAAASFGGGGGGGGAGAIILDVNGYGPTNLNVRAVGGDGGDTNHPTDTTGPGGGGGGGVYWMAGSSQPGVTPELVDNGEPGEYIPGLSYDHGADGGGKPGKVNNLRVPLRGFLFNTVPDQFTICSDQVPETIIGSIPKGGTGTYAYEWVDSTRSHSWQTTTAGVSNQKNLVFSGPLADTTWFRRIVTSGVLPSDTSFRIAVYVHPAITNNTISAPDTVCSGDAPQMFAPSATIGGGPTGGSFTYLWQKDEGGGFVDADGLNTGSAYQAPGLSETTDFRRIAYGDEGVCVDISPPLAVRVLEQLTGNNITPYDTVCFNEAPDQMTGPVPGEGEPSDKRYQWEVATNAAGPWTEVPGAVSQSYQASALTQTTYFRRVALSGSDDACVDNSDPVEILNIPPITGNEVQSDQTVCQFDQPALLEETTAPGGGYLGQYRYWWQKRTLSTGWVYDPNGDDVLNNFDPGIMDGDTTWYRRVVGSGRVARNECLDFSDSVAINVLPSITNNVITTADAVKCQFDLVEDLLQNTSGGSTPGGGATQGGNDPTRLYQWQLAKGVGTPGSWNDISGAEAIDYTDNPPLDTEDDHFYRRIVFSGPGQVCKDTTEVLRIEVHTQISGFGIEPYDSVCFADTKVLLGETAVGEPSLSPVYLWKDLGTGSDLPASDQEDFTTLAYNALGDYYYKREVSIGECSELSDSMTITVMQLPGGMLTDNAFRACEKDTVLVIDLTIEDLTTVLGLWEVYLNDGVNVEDIGPYPISADGVLNVTLDIDQDSIETTYEIASITYTSTEGRFSCVAPPANISGTVPIEIFRKPDPVIMVDAVSMESHELCGTTQALTVDADNGSGMWTSIPGGVSFNPGPTAEAIDAFIADQHEAYGEYQLTFRSEAGDCYDDDTITIHFYEQPAAPFAGDPKMVFVRNSVQLDADSATAGVGTWSVDSGAGDFADENDPKTWVYGLELGAENRFKWTINNGVCQESNDVVIVSQSEVLSYNGISPDNGDMLNNYLIMRGMRYADRFSISFFNSLGKTVRTIDQDNIESLDVDESLIMDLKEDERVVWDGKNAGGILVPGGTYYYVLQLEIDYKDENGNIEDTGEFEFKDFVVVMRE